jgi:hypothetical protein
MLPWKEFTPSLLKKPPIPSGINRFQVSEWPDIWLTLFTHGSGRCFQNRSNGFGPLRSQSSVLLWGPALSSAMGTSFEASSRPPKQSSYTAHSQTFKRCHRIGGCLDSQAQASWKSRLRPQFVKLSKAPRTTAHWEMLNSENRGTFMSRQWKYDRYLSSENSIPRPRISQFKRKYLVRMMINYISGICI